ncbi:hypothetical protein C8J56DRAFT_1044197 [Mycena floridula]|nr:hypothetical protein C8J56DRAFT_1044197 [Mycena floridula]
MQSNHSRAYSYDSSHSYDGHHQTNLTPYGGSYNQQSPSHPYPQSHPANVQSDPRYRAATPLAPPGHRHSRGNGTTLFNQSSPPPTSNSHLTYPLAPTTFYPNQNNQQLQHQTSSRRPVPHTGPRDFNPTPAQMVNYPHYPPTSHHGMNLPQPYGHQSAGPSRGDAPLTAGTAPERFVCNLCGKDFSRSHDRKRHYSTSHDTGGEKHVCEICRKSFSRGDSLKRHRDNGCMSGDS